MYTSINSQRKVSTLLSQNLHKSLELFTLKQKIHLSLLRIFGNHQKWDFLSDFQRLWIWTAMPDFVHKRVGFERKCTLIGGIRLTCNDDWRDDAVPKSIWKQWNWHKPFIASVNWPDVFLGLKHNAWHGNDIAFCDMTSDAFLIHFLRFLPMRGPYANHLSRRLYTEEPPTFGQILKFCTHHLHLLTLLDALLE
mgnify:CR=1 FL=1